MEMALSLRSNRTYGAELVMPMNAITLENDEMEYVDGGAYISGSACTNICLSLGMTGAGLIAAAGVAAVAARVGSYAASLGGPIGWAIKAVAGVCVGALISVARGIAFGAITGRGVTINPDPYPWDCFVSVSW